MYNPTKAEEAFRDVFLSFLMLLILLGNTLIIVAYMKNIRLRRGSIVFILGLAASDWLVGAAAVPLYIANLRRNYSPSSLLVRFFISLDILSGTASVFHLISVTMERYFAISRPYLHHTIVLGTYYRVLGVAWVLSLVLSCLYFVISPNVNRNYPFYVLLTVFSLALITITTLNILIFKITRSHIRNTVEPSQEDEVNKSNFQRNLQREHRERRAAATLAIICGVFFLTWFPHVIGAFVFTFCFPCNLAPVDVGRVGTFIKCMQYANSALNPFVFAFRDGTMRMTIVGLMPGACTNVVQPLVSSTRETTNLS